MAEQYVRIDNSSLATYTTVNPSITAGYVYSQDEIPGVAAAANHLSLTNPTGSGRTILIAGVFISSVTVGAVAAAAPIRGWLATGVSGGTLEASSTVGKMRSTMADPTAEVRIGNPTATLGAAWFNSPPILSSGAASAPFIHQVPATIPAGSLTLLPGESTVIRTESGDVDQRWNISIAWSEI